MVYDQQKTRLVRGALLFALALMFQGIRLIVPLPPGIGMFLIGSLVNATLLLSVRYAGLLSAVMMGSLLPLVAFMQGQLPILQLVPVVITGNIIMVLLFRYTDGTRAVWLLPVIKSLVLYSGSLLILHLFAIPAQIAGIILVVMGWPHLVTTTIGILLAHRIARRLPSTIKKS